MHLSIQNIKYLVPKYAVWDTPNVSGPLQELVRVEANLKEKQLTEQEEEEGQKGNATKLKEKVEILGSILMSRL